MKRLMLAALVATLGAGCAIAPNGVTKTTAPAAAQPLTPAYRPTPKAFGVNKNQCFVHTKTGYDGLLISGGRNPQGQDYSCGAGATMQILPLSPDLVAALVPYVCDATKPVTQTKVLDGDEIRATCVFRDGGIPEYLRGVRIQVVR
ncbi:hypothetical protein Q3O98_17250 [Ralstonia pseudosolanacearum]|uniref:hypothetical protein n=1 Tax=Ralstonia pseudosolanacearum TaxID=1310165 RepID=UPI0026757FBF|nr:hypothetical protein [Ralstonia pseudosolanacearum]MDO3622829.1 hypothetical protein [Ralstonia pseudosolanacearum]